jgi:hypothetical protein
MHRTLTRIWFALSIILGGQQRTPVMNMGWLVTWRFSTNGTDFP